MFSGSKQFLPPASFLFHSAQLSPPRSIVKADKVAQRQTRCPGVLLFSDACQRPRLKASNAEKKEQPNLRLLLLCLALQHNKRKIAPPRSILDYHQKNVQDGRRPPPPMEYKNLIEDGLFPSPPTLKELKEKKLNSKGVKEVIGRSTKEGRALPLTHSLKSLVTSSPKRQQVSTRMTRFKLFSSRLRVLFAVRKLVLEI